MTATLRIYVASLADYNAGRHHGTWIDDLSDPATVREAIAAMLAESPTAREEGRPAEEWAIHDVEGFGDFHVSEHAGIDELCAIAAGVEEHGAAFLAWASRDSSNRDVSDFEDQYRGEWDSLADYVADYWHESGAMPQAPEGQWWHPLRYTDWDRMADDLEMNGDVWTADAPDGRIWVFDNH